ncbi:MAG TPA: EAL domain-containing protein [Acidimicrobiales bacterium]
MKSGEETRLVVETLFEVIPGTQIVAIVTTSGEPFVGLEMEPLITGGAHETFKRISGLVKEMLSTPEKIDDLSTVIDGVEWGVLVNRIEAREGVIVGALIVAREGRVWSTRERSLGRGFGGLLSHVAAQFIRESKLLHQQRLDELVSKVAERLMSASSNNRQDVLNWVAKELCEFLAVDVAFIRRNDHVRGLSIMDAEWPVRDDVPDPDPLGEVPFDSDPIFAAMRDLRGPYLPGVDDPEEYLANIDASTGVQLGADDVYGAAVPLLMHDKTWGILGFLHFSKHTWVKAEINALQAVASLLVQLQARIDAEEQTIFNANHDDLTGLPNRRALIQELVHRLEDGRDTAVMIIDLDRFKVMNDFLGHASGDRLLVTIADRLRTSIRANDFAARLGGDEFVFLVDQITSEMEILATSFRLLEVISEPVDIHGQMFSHTASIGIALAPDVKPDAVEMLGWADVALYSAKSRGRNQAVVFDAELRTVATERSELELNLRDAIEEGGLRLHFQPEVDLRTGRLLALEALVRWEHPARGMIPAAEFITVAEETGLIVNIGRWVFAEACRTMASWSVLFPEGDFVLRINMSPAEFLMDDIVEFVEECLVLNGVPGSRVCIEITEYTVLDEPEKTAKILLGFQSLGVEVALDDFGTGFASMTELKNLPVNVLKLDLSFVQGITHDIYDRAIVESIIRLGSALSLKVVAEGIETTEIADKLVDLGCQRGQGYLISRPLPPKDLEPILRAGSVPLNSLRSQQSLMDHVVHG